MQNAVAHLLSGASHWHRSPVVQHVHCLPTGLWVEFRVSVMTYKSLIGLVLAFLRNCSSPFAKLPQLQSTGIFKLDPLHYKSEISWENDSGEGSEIVELAHLLGLT